MTERTSRQRVARAFRTLCVIVAATVIAFALRGLWV